MNTEQKSCAYFPVSGYHIQNMLEMLNIVVKIQEFKGTKQYDYQDEYKSYILQEPAISTKGEKYIDIKYYSTYEITIKNNIFTFAIHNKFSENHIIKMITAEEQNKLLKYLGFIIEEKKEEEEEEEEKCVCGECGISTKGRKIRGLWDNKLCEECGEHSDMEEEDDV